MCIASVKSVILYMIVHQTQIVLLFSLSRFEVQIEVPPPRTVEQRIAILKVHCNSMVNNGRVLVKDAPAGTAAWNRLQVSMYFMHKMISFNVRGD